VFLRQGTLPVFIISIDKLSGFGNNSGLIRFASSLRIPEMFNDRVTWHAMGSISERQALMWPGPMELGFVGPLTAYW
jgi:hypothetical protein